MSSAVTLLGMGLLACALLMTGVFLAYRITGKASWVDTAWAFGIGLCAILYCAAAPHPQWPALALAAVVVFYSWRLAAYLFGRTLKGPEDGRYVAIQARWQSNLALKFFFFFQFQAWLCVLLALPVLVAVHAGPVPVPVVFYLGILLAVAGIAGESLADNQLRHFKADPKNRGKVCDVGLWGISRHPNYFSGFLFWCGVSLAVLVFPWGWTALMLPALMLYFYLYVTGIPETEAQAVRSRGRAYQEYQSRVPAFFPGLKGFPKIDSLTHTKGV